MAQRGVQEAVRTGGVMREAMRGSTNLHGKVEGHKLNDGAEATHGSTDTKTSKT